MYALPAVGPTVLVPQKLGRRNWSFGEGPATVIER
jgi:hypothetical protein